MVIHRFQAFLLTVAVEADELRVPAAAGDAHEFVTAPVLDEVIKGGGGAPARRAAATQWIDSTTIDDEQPAEHNREWVIRTELCDRHPGRRTAPTSVGDVRHHKHVDLRAGLSVDDGFLAAFARAHGIRRLALFGSALRDDFGPDSDVDLLVEFQPEHTPGLLHLAMMELELEDALGRPVELRTPEDLSPYFRDQVATSARSLYAA